MSIRILALQVLLAGWVLLCPLSSAAQDRVSVQPVQADLVRAIDASRVKVGDPVFAKVALKWQSAHCSLALGAVLQGRIVAQTAHSKTSPSSELAVLFDTAQCDGRAMKPLPLTIAAVLGEDPRDDQNEYESQPLSDAVGLAVGGLAGGPSGASLRGSVSGGLRSVSAAAATVELSPTEYKGPSSIMPGQVVGIKGMKLNVGGGPEGSSVLTASGHNVRLEYRAQLVLVPNLSATAPVATSAPPDATESAAGHSDTTKSAAPTVARDAEPPAELDETELCLPPDCSVAVVPKDSEIATAAWATLSVKNLGYTPVRADHEMYAFEYNSAVSYLGPNEVLLTFNPHELVQRSVAESKLSTLRTIRAVLINVQDKKVVKTVDWKVPDARQYQWAMAQDRVLIHVGNELRLYGPGLKVEHRISLNGPLAFVRTSPSSDYLAVAEIQERHSELMHRQLEEAEEREPEEDVEIRVLDSNFRVLATVERSSRVAPPVLSDQGEIRLTKLGKNRWQIAEDAWDGQRRALATLSSTCAPQVTTLPPDLLFVIGCDRQTTGKWYRVLQPEGKTVLKGWSASAEIEQTATGVALGADFAIGMAEAAKAIAADSPFQTSDLAGERIAVYRAENGERLFAITIASPAPTVQSFALSPDGELLAVLQGDQLSFYKVPAGLRRR
jgi:hypothetical protein